jgi:hypothetical protein
MIKLKVTREQLHFICNIANPATLEKRIVGIIKNQQFHELDFNFTVLEIGVIASKKYLFDSKKAYKLNLSEAHAATLLILLSAIGANTKTTEWMQFLATKWIGEIHQQLTNYQPKYYGQRHQ